MGGYSTDIRVALGDTYDKSTDSLEAISNAISGGFVILQANTRAQVVFPSEVQIPESGTTNYRLYLYLFNTEGEMEAPDSVPTITIIDSAGNEEVAETSMTNVDTGRYYYVVAVANTETAENWIAQLKVIEGGDTRYYGANFDLVDIQTATDKLAGTESAASFSYLDAGGEQEVFAISTSTRKKLHGIFLDLTTLTQDSTVKVKHKIDGTNYRTMASISWVQGTDDAGVYFNKSLAINQDIQVTMEEGSDEGAARAIPYYYILEEME